MSETLLSCPGCQAILPAKPDSCCPVCGAVVGRPAESATSLWFYAADKQKKGPVSFDNLQDLLRSGALRPADMVLQAGSKQWQPAQNVAGLSDYQPPAASLADFPLAASGCSSLVDPAGWDESIQAPPPTGSWAKPPTAIAIASDTRFPDIPGYEILAELGRGGMGVVYMARHVQLKRVVALKVILAGDYASQEDRARFRAEAESVARLQNPHIVQIYEIGEHERMPYFSLEYVSGGSLYDQLDGKPLPPRQAAELMRLLAIGMQAAHSAGIVHRDLKPGNILLQPAKDGTASSAWGTPKISDFGLAKQLDVDTRTQTGTVLGTPQYMAPEQARGQVKLVGPAADIYALGAILYEILTGRPPFQGESTMDTLMLAVSTEPVAPSHLQPKLPRDLETICLKCLEKDPRKRYAHCDALADDLQRFLLDQPISARPIGWRERSWKWARRRPAVAGLLAAVIIVGLVGLVGVLTQWRQAVVARADADAARGVAEAETIKAKTALAKAEYNLYFHRVALAHREWQIRHIKRARELLGECPLGLRDWEWRYLDRLFQPELATVDTGEALLHVAVSPDGRFLASAGVAGAVKIWDVESRKEIAVCRGHTGQVWRVAFSLNGRLLASGGEDHAVRLWDVPSGKLLHTLPPHQGTVHGLAFHPDGTQLASAGNDVMIWDLASRKEVRRLTSNRGGYYWLSYHPDGMRLAMVGYQQEIEVVDLRTGTSTRMPAHERVIYGVAYSPDGRRLATWSADQTVELRDADSYKRVGVLRGANDVIGDVCFSADSRRVAAASGDQTAHVWDLVAGRGMSLRGHDGAVHGLAFLRDNVRLVSAGDDGALKFWDTRNDPEMTAFTGDKSIAAVAFAPDSQHFAAAQGEGAVRVWNRASRQLVWTWQAAGLRPKALAFSPDGQFLAAGGDNDDFPGLVLLWNLKTGQPAQSFRAATRVSCLAFGPNGTLLISTAPMEQDRRSYPIECWDIGSGQKIASYAGHVGGTESLACGADGRTVVSGGADRLVRVWDFASGKELHVLRGHQDEVASVAVHGQRVASASRDNTIKIWNSATGQLERTMIGHVKGVNCVAFSADGKRLASASVDSSVRLWDVATGQDVLTLIRHAGAVYSVAFSPDAASLISGGSDRSVLLWQAP